MNKLELNDNLAELYFLPKATELLGFIDGIRQDFLLIDDWSRLMDLAVDNELEIYYEPCIFVNVGRYPFNCRTFFKDYETKKEALKICIAMALVKLAEGK